jgi:peroxiredoxin
MPYLAIALAVCAALLYVLSPEQLIYSTQPLLVYALLLGSALEAWRSGPGKGRIVALFLAAVLGSAIFYVHSVHSRAPGASLNLAVGDRFPEVTLPTSTGASFASADLIGRSAALYLFYRGDWCPFCRTELGSLNEYYAPMRTAGVELFAVSVDPPEASEALRARLGVPFTFLSDGDGKLLDALGIRHTGGHAGKDIAYPAQVLVDRNGIVRWTFRADSYRQRAHPDEILAAIAALGN